MHCQTKFGSKLHVVVDIGHPITPWQFLQIPFKCLLDSTDGNVVRPTCRIVDRWRHRRPGKETRSERRCVVAQFLKILHSCGNDKMSRRVRCKRKDNSSQKWTNNRHNDQHKSPLIDKAYLTAVGSHHAEVVHANPVED